MFEVEQAEAERVLADLKRKYEHDRSLEATWSLWREYQEALDRIFA